MIKFRRTLGVLLSVLMILTVLVGNITVKAEVTTPEICFVGVEHSPLVEGDSEAFYLLSKNYTGDVQYSVFLYTEAKNTWENITHGYTEPVSPKEPYKLAPDKFFALGKYKLSIRVKRAGMTGICSDNNGDFDNCYTAYLNCVNRDDSNRVYVNGNMQIERTVYAAGESITINGIEGISGMKAPYSYKLHYYNVGKDSWVKDLTGYGSSITWKANETGKYMLDVWAKSSDSKAKYESWKLKEIDVEDADVYKEDGKIYTTDSDKTIIITGKNVTYKNAKIEGNLYIYGGNVTLENITVTGSIIIDTGSDGNTNLNTVTSKKIDVHSGKITDITQSTTPISSKGRKGTTVAVKTITVTGAGNATAVTMGQTLQMSAVVTPENASNKSVTWSVENGTGSATISDTGLMAATGVGTVTVKAAAKDGSGVVGTEEITVTPVLVSNITITGAGNATAVTMGQTLQMSAVVTPENASNKSVTWSVENGTGSAIISDTGLIAATGTGSVTVKATAADGSGVFGTKDIMIAPGAMVFITVTGPNRVITGQAVQMNAMVLPGNIAVVWSVENGTGSATISNNGSLNATGAGVVTVKATAADESGFFGTKDVTIIAPGDSTPPASPIYSPANNTIGVEVNAAPTLTFSEELYSDGEATFMGASPTGIIKVYEGNNNMGTALTEGAGADNSHFTVANDSSNRRFTVTFGAELKNQQAYYVELQANKVYDGAGNPISIAEGITFTTIPILVTHIDITGGDTLASGKTLQLAAVVSPENATNKSVTWTVSNYSASESAHAAIDTSGKLTAVSAGKVIVTATAKDGSGVFATITITII